MIYNMYVFTYLVGLFFKSYLLVNLKLGGDEEHRDVVGYGLGCLWLKIFKREDVCKPCVVRELRG